MPRSYHDLSHMSPAVACESVPSPVQHPSDPVTSELLSDVQSANRHAWPCRRAGLNLGRQRQEPSGLPIYGCEQNDERRIEQPAFDVVEVERRGVRTAGWPRVPRIHAFSEFGRKGTHRRRVLPPCANDLHGHRRSSTTICRSVMLFDALDVPHWTVTVMARVPVVSTFFVSVFGIMISSAVVMAVVNRASP